MTLSSLLKRAALAAALIVAVRAPAVAQVDPLATGLRSQITANTQAIAAANAQISTAQQAITTGQQATTANQQAITTAQQATTANQQAIANIASQLGALSYTSEQADFSNAEHLAHKNQPSGYPGISSSGLVQAPGGLTMQSTSIAQLPASGTGTMYQDSLGNLHFATSSYDFPLFGAPAVGDVRRIWSPSPWGIYFNGSGPAVNYHRTNTTGTTPSYAFYMQDDVGPSVVGSETSFLLLQNTGASQQSGSGPGLGVVAQIESDQPTTSSGTPFVLDLVAKSMTGRKSSLSGAVVAGEADAVASGPDDTGIRLSLDAICVEFTPSIDGQTSCVAGVRAQPASSGTASTGPVLLQNGFQAYAERAWPGSSFGSALSADGDAAIGLDLHSYSFFKPASTAAAAGAYTITFAQSGFPTAYVGDPISDAGGHFTAGTTIQSIAVASGVVTIGLSNPLLSTLNSGTNVTIVLAYGSGTNLNGTFDTSAESVTSQYGAERLLLNGEQLGNPTGGRLGLGSLNTDHGVYKNGVEPVYPGGSVSLAQVSLPPQSTVANDNTVPTSAAVRGLLATSGGGLTSAQVNTLIVGSQTGLDWASANVTPNGGGVQTTLAVATDSGDIRLDEIPGYHGDMQTLRCAVSTSAGSAALAVTSLCGTPFSAADVGNGITIDAAAATPTVGPIATIPVTSGGVYPQGSAFPTLTRTDSGGGSGLLSVAIMAVRGGTLVSGGSGCTNGSTTFESTGGSNQVPSYFTATVAGGTITSALTLVPNPLSGGQVTTGYWKENPPGASQTFFLAGANCTVAPTFQYTGFTLDHWALMNHGSGYPSTVAFSVTGGSPTTAPVLGAPTLTLVPPPLHTTIATVVDSTHVTLATLIGTSSTTAAVDIWKGHDDTPAYNAAVAQMGARAALGTAATISIPCDRNTYFVTLTATIDSISGGVHGCSSSFKGNVFVDPTYAGDVFHFHDTSRLINTAWLTNTVQMSKSAAGAVVHDLNMTGMRDSQVVQNAMAFRGRNDFASVYDLDFNFIHGACGIFGVPEPGGTDASAWYNESKHTAHIRCRSDGADGQPVIEISGYGNGSSNTDFFDDISIFNPRAPCIASHSEGAGGGNGLLTLRGIRCEGGTLSTGPQFPSDLIIIGSRDGVTPETGFEERQLWDDLKLISTAQDFAGIRMMAQQNPSTQQVPHNIMMKNISVSGQALGPVIDVESCRNSIFEVVGGDPSKYAADFVMGPTGSGAQPLINDCRVVPDAGAASSNFAWAIDSSTQAQLSTPVYAYGDPLLPGSTAGITPIPGTVELWHMQLAGCTGNLVGTAGAVSCQAQTGPASGTLTLPGDKKTGNFYGTPYAGTAPAITLTANRLYALPIYINNSSFTVTTLQFFLASSPASAANCEIYLFADTGAGKPGSTVLDSGNIALTTSSIGLQQAPPLTASAQPGGTYWGSLLCDSAVSVKGIGATELTLLGTTMLGSSTPQGAFGVNPSNGYYLNGTAALGTRSSFGLSILQGQGTPMPLVVAGF